MKSGDTLRVIDATVTNCKASETSLNCRVHIHCKVGDLHIG